MEHAHEVLVRHLKPLHDLPVAERVHVVEEVQHGRLLRRHDEVVRLGPEARLEGDLAEGVDPLEAAVAVGELVELTEGLDGLLHLLWEVGGGEGGVGEEGSMAGGGRNGREKLA